MSDHLHYFATPHHATVVVLPFALDHFLRDWGRLRTPMTARMPPQFSRDEWAYLFTFLTAETLVGVFEQTFGRRAPAAPLSLGSMARPRGPIAIWLPNNVSLLGPLTLVLLSLTGNRIRLKGGSHTDDLAGSFLEFARQHLRPGPLRTYLNDQVCHEVFDRDDPRSQDMAAGAQVRIVFGSDAAAAAIHAMPHPVESLGFSFVDRRSEAWIEPAAATDMLLRDLLKVFAVYGQAGCTSPRRVVLLDASPEDARALRDQLVDLWPQVVRRPPAMHVASANVMACQWAAALGWDARLTAQHAAILAVGKPDLTDFSTTMGLRIVPASVDDAVRTAPPNLQTLGHAFADSADVRWLGVLARTRAKRFVPIPFMHHFGPVWDGQAFWRQCFEEIEIHCNAVPGSTHAAPSEELSRSPSRRARPPIPQFADSHP